MKCKIIFLVFFCSQLKAQIVNGIVLDSISKKPIELVNIFFTETFYGTFTNEQGKFELNNKENTSDLLITTIGYESKKVKFSDFNNQNDSLIIIYLKPGIEALDEIELTDKKLKYSSTKTILSEREKEMFYSFQFGSENVTFIKNEFYKKGKIETLYLDLLKVKDYPNECKKCKVDYIVSLNIKFYEYNKKNKLPGKELYHKNIIVEPENKTYKFKIDVDSLNIDFPKEGVCIGVETINTKYVKPKTSFAIIAPAIKFTNTKSNKEVLSWSRYRNEGWIFKTDSNWKANNIFFKTIVVDLKVKIKKE
jgi:hypothetical protein